MYTHHVSLASDRNGLQAAWRELVEHAPHACTHMCILSRVYGMYAAGGVARARRGEAGQRAAAEDVRRARGEAGVPEARRGLSHAYCKYTVLQVSTTSGPS